MALKIGKPYEGSVIEVLRPTRSIVEMAHTNKLSGGDGERLAEVEGLAVLRTRQTVDGMTLLNRKGRRVGLRTSFINQIGPRTIRCSAVKMLLAEVVVRNAATGSRLQREPETAESWLPAAEVEFFHKHTLVFGNPEVFKEMMAGKHHSQAAIMNFPQGKSRLEDGNHLRRFFGIKLFLELKARGLLVPDPFMQPGTKGKWQIFHPKKPLAEGPLMEIDAPMDVKTREAIIKMALAANRILFEAFYQVNCEGLGISKLKQLWLADIKFEFGHRYSDGKLVLADVVNLDSLRLLKNALFGKENQISKQVFRDKAGLPKVQRIYKAGTLAMKQFAGM